MFAGESHCTDKWEQKFINFSNYGKGLRYIVWEDSGKSAEYWAGHYGTKIDAPSLRLALKPRQEMKVSRFIYPRCVPNKLPFATSFNTGCGPHLFVNGKIVKAEPWNNMLAQDAVVTLEDTLENKAKFSVTDKVAFDGSNSVEVDLSIPKEVEIPTDLPVSSAVLFKTEFDLARVDELEVSYFVKKTHQQSTADVALLIASSNGPALVLVSDAVDVTTNSRPQTTTLLKPTKCIMHGEWEQRMFVLSKPPSMITSIQLLAYHHQYQLVGWPASGAKPSLRPGLQSIYLGLLLIRERVENIPYESEEVQIETNWNSDSLYEGNSRYYLTYIVTYYRSSFFRKRFYGLHSQMERATRKYPILEYLYGYWQEQRVRARR